MAGRDDFLERTFGLGDSAAIVYGASSGLGARAAHVLAACGARVALCARRADRLAEQVDAVHAGGGTAEAFECDVTEDGACDEVFERAEQRLGRISTVVYAPGISPLGRAERHARAKWDAALATNLTGAFEASRSAARRWIERGAPGAIVHVASIAGVGAGAVHRAVGYAASKGGLVNLTRQLAVEWAPHGIRVNAIVPGYFATELTIDPAHGDIAPEPRERIETFTPMARVGRVEEIDSAIAFLAAPASSYVTGALVAVDGGWTAW